MGKNFIGKLFAILALMLYVGIAPLQIVSANTRLRKKARLKLPHHHGSLLLAISR